MSVFEISTDYCFFQVDNQTSVTGHVSFVNPDSTLQALVSRQNYFSGIFSRFFKKDDRLLHPWVLEVEIYHGERSTTSLTLRFPSKDDAVAELKNITTQFNLKKTPVTNLEKFVEDPRSLSLALTSQDQVERKIAQLVYQLLEKNGEARS